MFHSGSQALIDIWAALPRQGRYPTRAAFAPEALGARLPHVIMGQVDEAGVVLRLAGSVVERIHGRSLQGVRWLDLWSHDSRLMVHRETTQALLEARPVVIRAMAGSAADPLEVVIAPMKGPSGAPDRVLGLYQPLTDQADSLRDVRELTARMAVPVDTASRAMPTLAAMDGRRIA